MKKAFPIGMAILILLSLPAYGSGTDNMAAGEDAFYIALTNDCDSEIYGIHCEYYLGDVPTGGGVVTNSGDKPTPIKKSSVLSRDFIPADFPKDADLSTFKIQVYVILEEGQEVPTGEPVEMSVQYGSRYYLTLSGNNGAGFMVTKEES